MKRFWMTTKLIWWSGMMIAAFTLIGFAFWKIWGAAIFFGLSFGGLLFAAVFSESILIRQLGATHRTPRELEKTIRRVEYLWTISHQSGGIPRFLVYPDPTPNALVFRGLTGSGTAAISQGLVALLNETELRAVLFRLTELNQQAGMTVSSISAVICSGMIRLLPAEWRLVLFRSEDLRRSTLPGQSLGRRPIGGIAAVVLFPFIWSFLNMGRREPLPTRTDWAYSGATDKISRVLQLDNISTLQHLYLFSP